MKEENNNNLVDPALLREQLDYYPERLLAALSRVAESYVLEFFIIGGTVRDWLLGRIPGDLDITVDYDAVACCLSLIAELGGGAFVPLGCAEESAGRVVWRGLTIDFSSFRLGAKTIEEDLRLRDYTVNAMGVSFSVLREQSVVPQLIDPLNGLQDLNEKILRACPNAFVADPLRMLRGFRLCATLGFRIEEATRTEIARHESLIRTVSVERISHELELIMESDRAYAVIGDMARSGRNGDGQGGPNAAGARDGGSGDGQGGPNAAGARDGGSGDGQGGPNAAGARDGGSGLLWQIIPDLARGVGMEQPGFHHLDVFHHSLAALGHMEEILADPGRFYPKCAARIRDYIAQPGMKARLKWAALLHDIGKPVTMAVREDKDDRVTFYNHDQVGKELVLKLGRELRWSNDNRERVAALIGMHMQPFHLCNVRREQPLSRKACLNLSKKAGDDLVGLFLLAMSDSLAGQGEKKPPAMEAELAGLLDEVFRIYEQYIQPAVKGPRLLNGQDLIDSFSLSPGPLFAKILDALEVAQVEGEVVSKEDACRWVRQYLAHVQEDESRDT